MCRWVSWGRLTEICFGVASFCRSVDQDLFQIWIFLQKNVLNCEIIGTSLWNLELIAIATCSDHEWKSLLESSTVFPAPAFLIAYLEVTKAALWTRSEIHWKIPTRASLFGVSLGVSAPNDHSSVSFLGEIIEGNGIPWVGEERVVLEMPCETEGQVIVTFRSSVYLGETKHCLMEFLCYGKTLMKTRKLDEGSRVFPELPVASLSLHFLWVCVWLLWLSLYW